MVCPEELSVYLAVTLLGINNITMRQDNRDMLCIPLKEYKLLIYKNTTDYPMINNT